MFNKVFIGVIATMLSATVALAAPGARPAPKVETVEGYIKEVASKTNKSEQEIRESAIEVLRRSGKFSKAELERIGRGERVEFDVVKHNEAIRLLETNSSFRARTGLAAVRNESIRSEATEAFDAMRVERAAKPEVVAAKPAAKPAKKAEPTPMEKDVLALGNISKVVSVRATEAIKSVGAEHYPQMLRVGTVLARRVKRGQLDAAKVEEMILNIAASPKVLEGKLVVGEGATEACMGMAKEAVENMGEFIAGGAREGRDPVSYTRGMGRKAAEKFKQELEEGIARVCALASSGCKLFSSAIVKACKSMGAGRAI